MNKFPRIDRVLGYINYESNGKNKQLESYKDLAQFYTQSLTLRFTGVFTSGGATGVKTDGIANIVRKITLRASFKSGASLESSWDGATLFRAINTLSGQKGEKADPGTTAGNYNVICSYVVPLQSFWLGDGERSLLAGDDLKSFNLTVDFGDVTDVVSGGSGHSLTGQLAVIQNAVDLTLDELELLKPFFINSSSYYNKQTISSGDNPKVNLDKTMLLHYLVIKAIASGDVSDSLVDKIELYKGAVKVKSLSWGQLTQLNMQLFDFKTSADVPVGYRVVPLTEDELIADNLDLSQGDVSIVIWGTTTGSVELSLVGVEK